MPTIASKRTRQKPGETTSRLRRDVWALLLQLHEAEKPVVSARCQAYGVTPQQAYLLKRLEPGRPMPMNELARALGCDASNITGLVDRLEARGYVERQPGRNDRRRKLVAVTRSGQDFHLKLLASMLEPPPSVTALTQADLRALLGILRRAAEGREPGERGPKDERRYQYRPLRADRPTGVNPCLATRVAGVFGALRQMGVRVHRDF